MVDVRGEYLVRLVVTHQGADSLPDVVMIGGVGRNPGFMEAMRRELKLEKICIPDEPEYGAAVGAALVVAEEA